MSARIILALVVWLLVVLGGGVAAYKNLALGVPFWRGEQVHDWQIEAKVSFYADGKRVSARLSLPGTIDDEAVMDSGSLGYHFFVQKESGRSTAVWSAKNKDGAQSLYFRIRVPESKAGTTGPVPAEGVQAEMMGFSGALAPAAESLIQRAQTDAAHADDLVVSLFRVIYQEQGPQELMLLKRAYEKEHKQQSLLMLGIDLLNSAGVPARLAYGVQLKMNLGVQRPLALVEYHDGFAWKIRDPQDPTSVPDERSLFVWHRGGGPLLEVGGGAENSTVVFTVNRERVSQASLTDLKDSPFLVSTILGLPMAERAVFRYLVLIPLGAFVVVLMRNLIGVPTLGTFMPVLIALALLEIPLGRGLIMFTILIAVGLWFRFLLSRLNLLVVPRVAACVVIVTMLMMLMSVIAYRLGIGGGVQITLFPMIILAWTIERMSLIWEEEGKRNALIQVIGSLVVSVLAFLFMKGGQIQYWAFYFPELLLVLLAGILMIGRYTGYRLSELIRFKNFPED